MSKAKCVLTGKTKRDGERIVQEITDFARELNAILVEQCKRQIIRNGSIPTDFVSL